MIELLRRAAATAGDAPAIVVNQRTATHAELVDTAERQAAGLLERGITRFGIASDDAIDIVTLLAASSLIGAEACVYPGAGSPTEVGEIRTRMDHELVVSQRDDLGPDVEVVAPSALLGDRAAAPADLPTPRPLLVLTTGTTGAPKGVRQDWDRVLRPSSRTPRADGQVWLLAYGLNQFGGLQILLHVLASGALLVAPTPRGPREGLAAMRAHQVDHASGTPTFWRMVLAELRADGGPRPPLQQVTLGGEAVPTALLAQVAEAFPGARISQIYGANESGNARGISDGRNGLPVSLLGDDPDADICWKVVDGELWVRSRVGMLGYYGEPPIDPDAWRPTGDLVEIEGDRVQFRGRKSEIINVGGVKVHPLPIEEAISAVPGVGMARVFGRPSAVAGSIVAVEIVLQAGADADEVDAAVRDACAELAAAARPRRITFVDEIATKGHKVARGGQQG